METVQQNGGFILLFELIPLYTYLFSLDMGALLQYLPWSDWVWIPDPIKELSLAENPNFLISISLKPKIGNLWYFKLILFDLTDFIVWNI